PGRRAGVATAGNVLDEVGRLERLAGELLDLARFDAGVAGGEEAAARRERLDLADLVGREAASPEWRDGPVAPAVTVRTAPLTVLADPDLITRVLRNLLTNAARHARSEIAVDVGADVVAGMGAAGGVA